MLPPALLLPVLLASPAVSVEGSAECPSPAEVSEKLAAIMAVPEIEGPGDRVTVSSSESGVTVALRTAEGAVLGERSVSAGGTCDERARAAAVIIAAWLTDIHPEYRNSLPQEPPPPAPTALPEAAPAEAKPVETKSKAPPPRPHEPAPARRFSFAVAAGIQYSEPGVTPAFELSSRFALEETGFGAFAFALVTLPLERAIGAGNSLSFRWPVGAGPLFRLRAGSTLVDFGVAPAVGWLHVEGKDFEANESDDAAVVGALLGVRAAANWTFVRPFVSAGLLGWFTRSTVVAHAPEAAFVLPFVEATFLLGLSVDP
jgi:hypothetical protein